MGGGLLGFYIFHVGFGKVFLARVTRIRAA